MPVMNSIRDKLVRWAPAHVKSFVVVLLLVSDLRVGDAAAPVG